MAEITTCGRRDFEIEETLSTVLRERLGFTGVRVSCSQGACGACTILLNGKSALSCMMLAVEADGCDITTIEGIPADDPIVEAFANETDHGYGTAMHADFALRGLFLRQKAFLQTILILPMKRSGTDFRGMCADAAPIRGSSMLFRRSAEL